jgi:hypothetical protein
MHVKLSEGNGIAALVEPDADFARPIKFGNSTNTLAVSGSLIGAVDEDLWIGGAALSVVQPMNRSIALISEAEELEILSHVEVAEAVTAALPDVEAWEHTL